MQKLTAEVIEEQLAEANALYNAALQTLGTTTQDTAKQRVYKADGSEIDLGAAVSDLTKGRLLVLSLTALQHVFKGEGLNVEDAKKDVALLKDREQAVLGPAKANAVEMIMLLQRTLESRKPQPKGE